MKIIESAKAKISKQGRLVFIVLAAVTVAAVAVIVVITDDTENRIGSAEEEKGPIQRASDEISAANILVQEGDLDSAVESARKAVEIAPDDLDIITAAADVIVEKDSDEAKQLYAKALELSKAQDNPDEDGKTSTTYWAAANLAEQAGETTQAKKYYQMALDAADPSSVDDQNIVNKSRLGLERLQ